MRIGIQTWGSEGDFRPFLALAGELRKSGHKVKLVVTTTMEIKSYNEFAEKNKFELIYIATPIIKDMEELDNITRSVFKETFPLKQLEILMSKLFFPVEKEMFSASIDLCKESDLIIGHFIHHPIQIAAEIFKIPYVSVMTNHSSIPSKYISPSGTPDIGKWAYPIWWKLAHFLLNKSLLNRINNLRNINALPKANDILFDVWQSKILNLIEVSPIFCKKQKDWGPNLQICGFFNLPENTDDLKIPDDLKLFLDKGEPPVYMNFGSMMPMLPNERKNLFNLFYETAKLAKCRLVLQILETERDIYKSDNEIYYTTPIHHKKIFPYCSIIVHHGGSGTTQTSVLSGVPSIVIPHGVDQTFWGTELKKLGIAPDTININKLTPKKLAEKIKFVLNSSDMKLKAKQIGDEMQKENGEKKAVEIIESWV